MKGETYRLAQLTIQRTIKSGHASINDALNASNIHWSEPVHRGGWDEMNNMQTQVMVSGLARQRAIAYHLDTMSK